MCGIAGCYNHNLSSIEIANCLKTLKNRGPDDSNFFQDDNISLLHTRLSILDKTSRGSQPMKDEGKNAFISLEL